MKVNNPLMFRPEMILVYKGSNHVIHNSSDRMSHQYAIISKSLKINADETLQWAIRFKILDVTLILVMFGQKVYQEIEQEGEKIYIHLTNSYFYFKGTPHEKKIIIHGLIIYHKQYSEKCSIEERFKYQITFINDSIISKMLVESNRLFEEQMEMNIND